MAIRDLIDRFVLKWKAEGLASALHSSKLVILRPLYSRMDRRFDKQYAIETGMKVPVIYPTGNQSSFNHPEQYEAVPVAAFRSLLSILPKNLSDYIFIDYGSGKGRAVLLASERNFKAIIGIEYSPELYAISQSNVSRFLNRSGRNCRISLINEDAVNYAIPEDDCVLFFYNPFPCHTMAGVIREIERSYRQNPRNMFVIYLNPECASLFERVSFLRPLKKQRYASRRAIVYKAWPGAA